MTVPRFRLLSCLSIFCLSAVFTLRVVPLIAAQESSQSQVTRTINLPTTKTLSVPSPGRIGSTNGFSVTMVVSPDGRFAAMLNDGYGSQETTARQSIAVLDLQSNQLTDFPDDRFDTEAHQSFFIGLGFSSDGKHLYASVGSITDPTGEKKGDLGNGIAVYSFTDGKVAPERFISIAPQPIAANKRVLGGVDNAPPHTVIPYPAGLAVIADGGKKGNDKLLVANNLADNAVLLDAATGKVLQTFDLSTNDLIPVSYPYTCVATKDGRRAWCSLWNASQVAELDLTSGKVARWIKLERPDDSLAPGSHPTAMLLSLDDKVLYVALSNVDQVAAIFVGAESLKPSWYLSTSGAPSTHPMKSSETRSGSYPTALAQSADGATLFVGDSSFDAVAVFDVSWMGKADPGKPTAKGFIPTDWYPSALAVRGDDLLIATAKGEGTRANKDTTGKTPYELKHGGHLYIGTLLRGSVARLNIPATMQKLPEYTRMVENANLFHSDPGTMQFAGGQNPIKHVIYILRENRTYDQILGDLGVGDGDPSLTMFGADITPNAHALAKQFGVLDNFYDSGEVSGDGHIWSSAAIASDYNEKTWQIAYRGKERTYDFQGQVGDEFPLEHNIPDVDDPGTGFLWDNLARNHVSYRYYGEFVNAGWCNGYHADAAATTPPEVKEPCTRKEVQQGEPLEGNVGDPHGTTSPWPWGVPTFNGVKPSKANLRDHFDPLYPDFNTDYPDQLRADEFMNEFGAFVRARQNNAPAELQMPAFILLYLPDDHTGGTRPGHARPAASVADNDLAVGRVVDAVSHSPYWDDTAIFILEDDAQNGADHVDAHRSVGLVISKYSPKLDQPYVEHRFYTTVNTLHTMETLLGLPPMNQNDAYAPLMTQMFSGAGSQAPFKADYRNQKNGLIYQRNPEQAPGAKASMKMDFSRPDAAGAAALNEVLWRDQKGNAPMPKAKHTVFPAGEAGDE